MTDTSHICRLLNLDTASRSDLHKYLELRFIREVELFISTKYKEQVFRCPVHLSVGQEAVAVGVSWNLRKSDKVISTHRSHAHYLAKGGNLFRMFAELLGSPIGCCGGRGGSMHIFDKSVGFIASIPIVGSSLPISSGLAMAEKLVGSTSVVVAFIGDASLETGAFYETLNLASLKQLPLLVVIEDNGYSTYANKSVRVSASRNSRSLIEGFGIKFLSGNGDNLDEVIEVTREATEIVRHGAPAVVEFSTFRLLEHCGPNNDDSLGYRSSSEIESYKQRDPLIPYFERIDSSDKTRFDDLISEYVAGQFQRAFDTVKIEYEKFQGNFRP